MNDTLQHDYGKIGYDYVTKGWDHLQYDVSGQILFISTLNTTTESSWNLIVLYSAVFTWLNIGQEVTGLDYREHCCWYLGYIHCVCNSAYLLFLYSL